MKSRLTEKDRGQEKKGTTDGEMVGWHRRLNAHEFEQAFREMVKDREAWHAAVYGVTKSWTRLSDFMTQLHESLQQRFKQDPELLMGDVLPKTT